jgi:Fe-S-cluster-containing dehydrogenase component
MSANRREFLRNGVLAFGAAATGAGAAGLARAQSGQSTGGKMTALTVGGKLVEVDAPDGQTPVRALGPGDPELRKGIPGRKWIMVIDLAKCDGCGECIKSCSKMHFIPDDRQWIKVLRMQDSENAAPYFFPQPCYHCDNPPCTKVCPVDATFKREDGIVLIDNERCVGCRFCMAACPYQARSFNWAHPEDPAEALAQPYSPEHGYPRKVGTVEKCDFCPDMARQGKLPGCVTGCPMGAIYYGDENEDAVTNSKNETERLSKLLRDNAGYRHMEDLGTKPRVYYLPPKSRIFPTPDEKQSQGESS